MKMLGIDTETNGLPRGSRVPRMIQLGAMVFGYEPHEEGILKEEQLINSTGRHQLVEIATFDEVLDPDILEGAWDEEAANVHGITLDQVREAPPFFEEFHRFADMCVGCVALVGYNVKYDIDVLYNEIKIIGMETRFPWPPHVIDVQDLARNHLPHRETKRGNSPYSLGEAYQLILGREMENAHDAMADIRQTVELYLELSR